MKNFRLLILVLACNICSSQNIFKNESLGFSMEQPENWIIAKNGQTITNLKEQIKLEPEILKKLLEDNKGTFQVVAFYKYPIDSYAGIIPTIKVNLRTNSFQSFDDFKKSIIESFKSIKNVFPDFKFLSNPITSEINGLKCVVANCSYTLKANTGNELVKILVYAIPIKSQFYQITFMDTEKDENTKLFEQLAQTINIK